jgi:hypothetical protein
MRTNETKSYGNWLDVKTVSYFLDIPEYKLRCAISSGILPFKVQSSCFGLKYTTQVNIKQAETLVDGGLI